RRREFAALCADPADDPADDPVSANGSSIAVSPTRPLDPRMGYAKIITCEHSHPEDFPMSRYSSSFGLSVPPSRRSRGARILTQIRVAAFFALIGGTMGILAHADSQDKDKKGD